MAAKRRRGRFLQGCHPREVTQALVDDSTPTHMLTAISGLCSFFFKSTRNLKGVEVVLMEEELEGSAWE